LCLEAELLATEADAPIVHLEVARVRARLAGAAAQEWECRRQVDTAVRLAAQHGWVNVTTALRSEFGFARVGSTSSRQSSHLSMSTPSPSASRTYNGSLQNRRSLDALLALGMAAAAVHDPDELAVVALDQLVALLAAERAFLFLQQEDGTLTVAAARDAAGSDLVGVSDFASTIVDEVSEHHRALVVTGTAEGAALGSESAVLHDLRSILAAPLTLEGRFLGVVYLDSRLAKGIFTADDVEILSAMSTHIAVSLMTARATKLEVTVAAEREQRHVAETLRDFMTEVSSSVEPDEVLARALITARQLVNYDRAAILSRRGRDWVVQTSVGELDLSSADKLGSHSFLIDMEPTTAPLLVVDASGPGAPPPPPLFAGSGSWIALPSVIGGRLAGVVLYGTDRAGGLGPAQLVFAATFAAQAVSAFVNAEQYQQIQRLATTDELTAVNNRRNFFQLGAQAFSQARRYQRPLAAVMIDIDHFKRVNDTHGHTVGDEVIETVARRLRAVIREVDVIGRYGGEEFALVLPETSGAAANLVAERLRHALQDQPVDTAKGPLTVTVSLGVAVMDPLDADLPAALKRADEALYEAKRQGRNSVVMAPPPGPPDQPAADRDGA
jgi:diguanylate cyclase (GGDEF)-like protein